MALADLPRDPQWTPDPSLTRDWLPRIQHLRCPTCQHLPLDTRGFPRCLALGEYVTDKTEEEPCQGRQWTRRMETTK